MRFAASNRARLGLCRRGVAVAGALLGSAEASVIRPTASLPLIDVSLHPRRPARVVYARRASASRRARSFKLCHLGFRSR